MNNKSGVVSLLALWMVIFSSIAQATLPVADAGPDQNVLEGSTVTLDGTLSNDSTDGGTITLYAWSQTAGTDVTLSDTGAARPTFAAPTAPATLTFSLTVTDNNSEVSTADSVSIIVEATNNVAPVANAGVDQTVVELTEVTLTGEASNDSDGTISSYAWSQTSGTGVTLSDTGVVSPTFTAPAGATTLTFALVVTDDDGATSVADTVNIIVTAANITPTANAGTAQSVTEGEVVTLDGTGSIDSDGTISSYTWTETTETDVTLMGNGSVNPTFTAPVAPATVSFSLVVTDNEGGVSTNSSNVNITVTAIPNVAPTANAGPDQSVEELTMVTLTAASSNDSDGNITSYAWSQTAGSGVTLSDAGAVSPTFTAPAGATTLTFALVVTDDDGATSVADTVNIIVTAANITPVANAGVDQTVEELTTVTLNGTGSSDIDGTVSINAYTWTETTSTGVTLTGTTTANPTFVAPAGPRTVRFSLVVIDNEGARSVADSVTINVKAKNIAPQIIMEAVQGRGLTHVVIQSEETVTVSARVTDANSGDEHSYDWSATDNVLEVIREESIASEFRFKTQSVDPGFYTLRVSVNDGSVEVDAEFMLRVLYEEPVLLAENDSDGDGKDDASEGYGDADNDGIPDYLDTPSAANVLQGHATQKFLMETDSGLVLSLGMVAFKSGARQAGVSSEDVTNFGNGGNAPVDEYTNSGGLFDFVIQGLPTAGDSVRLVLPQIRVIPENALYRKLLPTGWFDFRVDSKNRLYSTAGQQGYCPPPGDAAYTPGLKNGHWCVQLLIEDGGYNDADNLPNQRISDPGGVAQLTDQSTEETVSAHVGSSGGALHGLTSLLALLLWILRQMVGRKKI